LTEFKVREGSIKKLQYYNVVSVKNIVEDSNSTILTHLLTNQPTKTIEQSYP